MRKNESGFTLVELLVATLIASLIVSFSGTAIYQFLTVTERSTVMMTALHEVQNAGFWFTQDGQTASNIIWEDTSSTLTLTMTIPSSLPIIYIWNKGTKELSRDSGTSIIIARNVSNFIPSISTSGTLFTLAITSAPQNRWDIAETKTYYVFLRPNIP